MANAGSSGLPRQPRTTQLLGLHLTGVDGAIVAPVEGGLIRGLTACLFGWPPALSARLPEEAATLAALIEYAPGRFRLGSRNLAEPMSDLTLTSAVCAVIADIALGYCDALPGGMGLHCGAFRFADGPLVLLAGPHRSGKSTLIARLAMNDRVEIFGDDVLPINAGGVATALGLAPRIRLPSLAALPDRITSQIILRDDRYAYIRPRRPALHGTRARPKVLIALERDEAVRSPCLHRMPCDTAVTLILRQRITEAPDPGPALRQARGLADRMTCLTLRYSDLEQAAHLLERAFGSSAEDRRPDFGPPRPFAGGLDAQPADMSVRLRREAGVHIRRLGEGLFLWRLESPKLWHLNPLGHAIWTLLDAPQSPAEIASILCGLFADVPARTIAADVATFMGAACAAGLLTED